MRSFAVIAAAVGLASAHASASWGAPVYVTDVVTAYTTYCPSATMISHNGVTYTVTEATTLTISNCPCTVTRPVSSFVSASSVCSSSTKAASSAMPTKPVPTGAPMPAPVSSTYVVPSPKVSTSATSSAPAATYTGAANKAQVAGGLIAAVGLVAAAL